MSMPPSVGAQRGGGGPVDAQSIAAQYEAYASAAAAYAQVKRSSVCKEFLLVVQSVIAVVCRRRRLESKNNNNNNNNNSTRNIWRK